MRNQKNDRLADTYGRCFICGIGMESFNRASDEVGGFARHVRQDHWMWNYCYFIVYILEQDKDADDGLEAYVRKCLETDDVTWFPISKAMCLADPDEENIDTHERIALLERSMRDLLAQQSTAAAAIARTLERLQKSANVSQQRANELATMVGRLGKPTTKERAFSPVLS